MRDDMPSLAEIFSSPESLEKVADDFVIFIRNEQNQLKMRTKILNVKMNLLIL